MAFGLKHKIVALLAPVVGASFIAVPATVSAMETPDATANFACEIARGGSNPSRQVFPFSNFPVRVTTNIDAPANAGVGEAFDYTLKNFSASFPSMLPGAAGTRLVEVSHVRISLPFLAEGGSLNAEVPAGSGGVINRNGGHLMLSGGETTDNLDTSRDIDSITEPKGIKGSYNGGTVDVAFPDTTLKVPAQSTQKLLRLQFPFSFDYRNINDIALTAAGVAINGNDRYNVLFRCTSPGQNQLKPVHIVSKEAAAVHSLNFSQSARTITLDKSTTLTGLALDKNGRPAPKGVAVTLGSDQPLGTYTNAQAVTDENGVFRFEFTARRSEAFTEGEPIDLYARLGGITSPTLRLTPVAAGAPNQEQNSPNAIEFAVTPSTVAVGATATIDATLKFANGTPANLPESITFTIDGTAIPAKRKGQTATYSATYTPTTPGKKTIGTTVGDATAFTVLEVTEAGTQPGGSSSSSLWKIIAGVLGALGAIGALIAGALSFLPGAFKF